MDRLDRAYGALVGGAIGDAMGMPASFLTRQQIRTAYGYIQDFLTPQKEVQSYHGNLQAGEITDDTMESVIITRVLLNNGEFSEAAFNEAMKDWAIRQRMLESTVIGPSTRRYLEALIQGRDPKITAGQGVTNGSAMRVAPIGVRYWKDLGQCLEMAAASSLPSHGSRPAVAAACAVAAGVSLGVHGGYSSLDILRAAADGAAFGEKKGMDLPAPSVARRLRLVEEIVDQAGDTSTSDILDELVAVFGASMMAYESVPIAFGAFYATDGHGPDGVLAAINAGDDADTNGSICGSLCGAFSGALSFPVSWRMRVEKTSGVNFYETADQLLTLEGVR